MTTLPSTLWLAVGLIAATVVAVTLTTRSSKPGAIETASLDELWQEPGDIGSRDLLWGPGGQGQAPSPDVEYTFRAIDVIGHSAGFDVTDPAGREWDVKIGDEAQPEVVASRLLWAVGYHQPLVYYLPEWRLKDGPVSRPYGGRFRLESGHDLVGDWPWLDNPFRGTRELKGLIVANLLINNWDLKSTNNKIFSVPPTAGPQRWFVVQDIGASFGKTAWPIGSRHRIDDYESQQFVFVGPGGRMQFDYHGRHQELLDDISAADVVWVSTLFAQLSDRQWADAFQAAAMPGEISGRYIRKLKSKVQEGLGLRGPGKVK